MELAENLAELGRTKRGLGEAVSAIYSWTKCIWPAVSPSLRVPSPQLSQLAHLFGLWEYIYFSVMAVDKLSCRRRLLCDAVSALLPSEQ